MKPFLENTDFSGSFRNSKLDSLRDFVANCNDAEHQFNDGKYETLRSNLLQKAKKLLDELAVKTFPEANAEFNRVPPEWKQTNPVKYSSVVKTLNGLSRGIVKIHQELMSLGRQEYGVM